MFPNTVDWAGAEPEPLCPADSGLEKKTMSPGLMAPFVFSHRWFWELNQPARSSGFQAPLRSCPTSARYPTGVFWSAT